MSQKFENLKVGIDESLEEKLALLMPGYTSYQVLRESIDARKRHSLHRVVTVEVYGPDEAPPDRDFQIEKINFRGSPVLIVGSGPAGLFAALRLVERGIPCVLFERGSDAVNRLKAINRYWRYGELNLDDNVCFGEGGAGLYSDGKLMTRIKSPHIPYVLRRLVDFGAPKEIEWLANPHVGSDRIRRVIPFVRKFLLENGCTIRFNTKVTELLTEKNRVTGLKTATGEMFHSDHVILATGHSARDMFEHLRDLGVHLEGKSFAMGLRIEHPQKLINQIQYRQFAEHPKLGSANYKLTYHIEETNTGIYSFCMCPGGFILSSGTDPDGVVCNGMSNYHRNSPFANSGIVVSIDYQKHFGGDVFAGLEFQRGLERLCKQNVERAGGTKEIPAQLAVDFMEGRLSPSLMKSSCPSGVVSARLDELLPPFLANGIKEGLLDFERKMRGFLSPQAQLHGIESRTSSPVRVTRNPETMQSLSHAGLYPVGEGAGYAGGITSAAVDGIKAVEAIVAQVQSQVYTH
ncbi:MAG TPA: FAD-dependent oxidoreductase [Bdellovibrionales bacterium]|nr:FAD-dependent oxidoreductase [Bdellovibrionales bacterium]